MKMILEIEAQEEKNKNSQKMAIEKEEIIPETSEILNLNMVAGEEEPAISQPLSNENDFSSTLGMLDALKKKRAAAKSQGKTKMNEEKTGKNETGLEENTDFKDLDWKKRNL